MTEIGIIFERVKIVPRGIEIIKSIARKGCQCIKTLLSALNFHQLVCKTCKENHHLLSPKWTEPHGSLPASATSFDGRLYQNGKGRKPMRKFFQKLSYFMMYPAFWGINFGRIWNRLMKGTNSQMNWEAPSSGAVSVPGRYFSKHMVHRPGKEIGMIFLRPFLR